MASGRRVTCGRRAPPRRDPRAGLVQWTEAQLEAAAERIGSDDDGFAEHDADWQGSGDSIRDNRVEIEISSAPLR